MQRIRNILLLVSVATVSVLSACIGSETKDDGKLIAQAEKLQARIDELKSRADKLIELEVKYGVNDLSSEDFVHRLVDEVQKNSIYADDISKLIAEYYKRLSEGPASTSDVDEPNSGISINSKNEREVIDRLKKHIYEGRFKAADEKNKKKWAGIAGYAAAIEKNRKARRNKAMKLNSVVAKDIDRIEKTYSDEVNKVWQELQKNEIDPQRAKEAIDKLQDDADREMVLLLTPQQRQIYQKQGGVRRNSRYTK